ncbi:MAG: hypothetical protein ISS92_00505 [Candidatus Omnitrophica bacterium]|nr:hypothetical protein [Candidatus Omnitrophota bacterium]
MSIEILRKEFYAILELEKRAKHFYNHYIDQLEDEKIKEKLVSIRNDEAAHIKLAENLIKLAS